MVTHGIGRSREQLKPVRSRGRLRRSLFVREPRLVPGLFLSNERRHPTRLFHAGILDCSKIYSGKLAGNVGKLETRIHRDKEVGAMNVL